MAVDSEYHEYVGNGKQTTMSVPKKRAGENTPTKLDQQLYLLEVKTKELVKTTDKLEDIYRKLTGNDQSDWAEKEQLDSSSSFSRFEQSLNNYEKALSRYQYLVGELEMCI